MLASSNLRLLALDALLPLQLPQESGLLRLEDLQLPLKHGNMRF
jgi:hypothetical protein